MVAPGVQRREDVLVSVCFGDMSADASALATLQRLASELQARFRFHEIIVLAEESRQGAFLPFVHQIPNLRLLTVRDGTAFYRRRVIAAEEAIGDVVLLASLAELPGVDALALLERAHQEQSAVLATRGGHMGSRSLGAPLEFIGRLAGFQVNLHDLQSLALPRTVLHQLLSHTDPDLALRFPPRDVRMPLLVVQASPAVSLVREAGIRRRLLLLEKLLAHMAPRLLLGVTLASGVLALLGLAFGCYVLGVWLLRDSVAPGWLTLSAATSLTAFFLGISMTGLSLGLQQLLSRTQRDSFDGVVNEVNRIDLFGQVATDLNVEFERHRTDAQKSQRA